MIETQMGKDITIQDLEKIKREMLEEIAKMLSLRQSALPSGWMKSRDVRKLLNLSSGKLLQLRTSGHLPYTKVGRIIYYEVSDVEKLLRAGKSTSGSVNSSSV